MAFGYYASITVDKTKVPNTDQTDFPILVSGTYAGAGGIPDLRTTGNGGKVQNANGYDIYFYSDSALTTRIPAERESYNASTGEIVFWVKKTVLTATDVVIYIAYGDSGISTDPNSDGTYGATSVWDTNYKGVWHFPDGTTLTSLDSTSNGVNATAVNTPTAVAGKIDGGANLAVASTQYFTIGNTINPAAITMSCWVKATAHTNGYASIIDRVNAGGSIYNEFFIKSSGKLAYYASNGVNYDGSGTNTLSTGTWYYLVVTYSSTAGFVSYVNAGVDKTLGAALALDTTAVNTRLGSSPRTASREFNGVLDECRISSIVRTANWITTEYNNQNSPSTFYTMGSETATGGGGGIPITNYLGFF